MPRPTHSTAANRTQSTPRRARCPRGVTNRVPGHAPALRARRALRIGVLASLALSLGGCVIPALIGGVAQSAYEAGSHTEPAQYTGLVGKSYAVVVDADRLIEADHPGLVARVTDRINAALAQNAGAASHIPSPALLSYLLERPQWRILPRGELAEQLGVERLIVVELSEYALTEAGNQYLWAGVATGVVSVHEADGPFPDEAVFDRDIRVTFPDSSGILREQIPEAAVTSELSRRFCERSAWLFYEHEEANVIPY